MKRLMAFLPTFLFLVLLMTAFMSFSHGTQDVYPTFLTLQAKLSPGTVGLIGLLYGLRVDCWRVCVWDALRKMGTKAGDCDCGAAGDSGDSAVGLWTFGVDAGGGAVLMQFMVQGAWGVVPAYLTELTPAPIRATAPGFAYQLGGLITSWNGKGQALAAERWGNYPAVLAITVVVVALTLAGLAMLGREAKGSEMTVA